MRLETLLTAGLVVLAVAGIASAALAPRATATGGRLWFATLSRLVLAGYLGLAGLLKLPDPAESVRAVRAYRILPESVVPTVGYVLPVLEVAVAILLVLGLTTRLAAELTSLLMVAFIIGIASVAARGINIDCGCFGGGGDVAEGATHYTQEIIRDACLLVLALLLVYRPSSRLAVDPRHHTDEDGDLDADLDDESDLDTDVDEAAAVDDTDTAPTASTTTTQENPS
jgi:uncharacterized membrane protein YphA (DoxX/SURF4 family)